MRDVIDFQDQCMVSDSVLTIFNNNSIISCFYTLKKIDTLPNLYPGEEPLRSRADVRNPKKIREVSEILFRFRISVRKLKGSSSGCRSGNIPIVFRV